MVADDRQSNRLSLILQVFLIVLFNALPLYFLWQGQWAAFDVIGFYWLEVVAAGVLAWVRTGVSIACAREWGARLSHAVGFVFFPLHFGLFIVILCFPVGSFLPPDTPKQPLTDALLPLRMVVMHVDFWRFFPAVLVWQGLYFLSDCWRIRHAPADTLPQPLLAAYGMLAILFLSMIIGIFIAMPLNNPLWGGVILVAIKTLCALAVLLGKANAQRAQEQPVIL